METISTSCTAEFSIGCLVDEIRFTGAVLFYNIILKNIVTS